jgi:hypothetical protein
LWLFNRIALNTQSTLLKTYKDVTFYEIHKPLFYFNYITQVWLLEKQPSKSCYFLKPYYLLLSSSGQDITTVSTWVQPPIRSTAQTFSLKFINSRNQSSNCHTFSNGRFRPLTLTNLRRNCKVISMSDGIARCYGLKKR